MAAGDLIITKVPDRKSVALCLETKKGMDILAYFRSEEKATTFARWAQLHAGIRYIVEGEDE